MGSNCGKVKLMYQMHEFYKVHITSAILAFFTPQESATYGYHPCPRTSIYITNIINTFMHSDKLYGKITVKDINDWTKDSVI